MRLCGSCSAKELADRSGLSRSGIMLHLRKLIAAGKVETEGSSRSPNQRYRLKGT